MYFPYLRGRQFELIALREFANERGDNKNVIPIVEPVKKTFNSIKIALNKFKELRLNFALILNPQIGEIGDYEIIFEHLAEILNLIDWIPAFILNRNTADIQYILKLKGLRKIMIILGDSVDTGSGEFLNFVKSDYVEYIVSKENRTLKKSLRNSGKRLIRLDSCFNQQRRNADYLRIPEEKFTEEHLFYNEDGYFGFSDFTTLPDEYIEGGTSPYAISIHLTYKKENDEIWIRHFTSESNDDQANIQGKFAEAAEKAVNFLDNQQINTHASNELRRYYHEARYPGLGMIKKISIKHHLEVVNNIL